MKWKERYPHGLVETVAEGDNQGKFELLIGVPPRSLYMKHGGKVYSLSVREICDSFFNQVSSEVTS